MFDLSEARRRDCSHGLLDPIIGCCKKLRTLLLIRQRFPNQFVGLFVGHLVVRARIFPDIFYPLVIQLGQLHVVLAVDWPHERRRSSISRSARRRIRMGTPAFSARASTITSARW